MPVQNYLIAFKHMGLPFLDNCVLTINKTFLFRFVLAVAVCLLANIPQSKAQPVDTRILTLTDNYESYFLSPYVIQYNDPKHAYSAKDILTQTNLRTAITEVTGSITVIDNSGDTKWFVLDVINRSEQKTWVLDFGNNFNGRFGLLDELELYTFNEQTRLLSRNNTSNENALRVNIDPNQKMKILFKTKAEKGLTTTFPLKLVHPYVYQQPLKRFSFLIAAILLSSMAFFFAAISFMQKRHDYLFISLYYISFILYLVAQNAGVTGTMPLFGAGIIPLCLFLTVSTGYLIARIFWDIENAPYLWDRLFYAPIAAGFFIILFAYFIPLPSPFIKMVLFYGPTILLLSALAFGSILKSQTTGTEIAAFMFGWFIMLFGVAISILSLSGTMQPISSAISAYWFALIPQAFFFVMASYFKLSRGDNNVVMSKTLEINESDTVSRLKKSVENTEQERLLKVIEQERKILSELRKSEARRTEEMRKAKEDADQANKAKSNFLAVVTHEIRTPMTGIMGMVRLLLDSNLSKDQKEYAQIIQDSSDSMLALLNDILDFEKIEQGKMTFENISFDLSRLIQGVARLMNGHAAQKNIELVTKIGENIPKYVKGDPNRLRQVLLNLTGNAVKFTSEGEVVISCDLIETNRKNKTYEIYFGVADSGIGISPEAQKNLFNPFAQADKSISRKFGGTGLGLAISNGLVQSMGSTININSQEGQGSTFFFTITLPEGTGDDIEDADKSDSNEDSTETKAITPINILIVDDNETNRKVIRGFLGNQNHTMYDAGSAQESFDILKENDIDLILMDIEMPGISGDEATRQLRQSRDPLKRLTPVVAITGNVMPDHIERFQNAGMNDYLAKPIDPKKLFDVVSKAAEGYYDISTIQLSENILGGAQNPEPSLEEEDEIMFEDIERMDTPDALDISQEPQVQPQESMPSSPLSLEEPQPAETPVKEDIAPVQPVTPATTPTEPVKPLEIEEEFIQPDMPPPQKPEVTAPPEPPVQKAEPEEETFIQPDVPPLLQEESPVEPDPQEEENTILEEASAPVDSGNIFNPDTVNTLKGHMKIEEIHQMLTEVIEKTDEITGDMKKSLVAEDLKMISSKGHELKGMAGNFGFIELSQQAAEIEARGKDSAILVLTSLIDPLPEMKRRAEKAIKDWVSLNS